MKSEGLATLMYNMVITVKDDMVSLLGGPSQRDICIVPYLLCHDTLHRPSKFLHLAALPLWDSVRICAS